MLRVLALARRRLQVSVLEPTLSDHALCKISLTFPEELPAKTSCYYELTRTWNAKVSTNHPAPLLTQRGDFDQKVFNYITCPDGALVLSLFQRALVYYRAYLNGPSYSTYSGVAFHSAVLKGVGVFFFGEGYACDAATNVSQWTTNLYKQVFTMYKEQSIAKGERGRRRLSQAAEPFGHLRYSLFKPTISCPPGTTLHRYGGSKDGGKWLCSFSGLQAPCTIFSLGSCKDFSFEAAMLEATECAVHTFDCTVPGKSLSARHFYHKMCIGTSSRTDFITLDKAVAMVGASSLDLLKMDIEGYEYDVFADWNIDTKYLPKQLSFEVHYTGIYARTPNYRNMSTMDTLVWPGVDQITLSQLAVMFLHLSNLGYGTVSQEPNVLCQICSEFTMMQVPRLQTQC